MIFDDMARQGNMLFRYRSILPFLVLPLAAYYFFVFIEGHGPASEMDERLVQHLALALSLCGVLLRAVAVGYAAPNTSGRNTTKQKADSLNVTGVYSVMRHPLYTANYLVFAGFLSVFQSLSFLLVGTLLFFVYYERIAAAEEVFLRGKFGKTYEDWAAKTPAFFPNPFLWVPPARAFSLRKVFRQEPPGWLLVAAYFAFFEVMDDVVFEQEGLLHWTLREPDWPTILAIGLCLYGVSKFLRKKTALLNLGE